jgi:glycosyltransferase involved in cell wall biosynthesis
MSRPSFSCLRLSGYLPMAARAVWLQGREQPENKVIIFYVERISWEKNLDLLVQAYQTLSPYFTLLSQFSYTFLWIP